MSKFIPRKKVYDEHGKEELKIKNKYTADLAQGISNAINYNIRKDAIILTAIFPLGNLTTEEGMEIVNKHSDFSKVSFKLEQKRNEKFKLKGMKVK